VTAQNLAGRSFVRAELNGMDLSGKDLMQRIERQRRLH
jgi:hypothetical protein